MMYSHQHEVKVVCVCIGFQVCMVYNTVAFCDLVCVDSCNDVGVGVVYGGVCVVYGGVVVVYGGIGVGVGVVYGIRDGVVYGIVAGRRVEYFGFF